MNLEHLSHVNCKYREKKICERFFVLGCEVVHRRGREAGRSERQLYLDPIFWKMNLGLLLGLLGFACLISPSVCSLWRRFFGSP
jgi:hypothetical protein